MARSSNKGPFVDSSLEKKYQMQMQRMTESQLRLGQEAQ